MHEEQSAQNLVHEVLDVFVAQFLSRVDHSMKVRLHQVSDDVDVRIACLRLRLQNVHQSDDVVVLEEL